MGYEIHIERENEITLEEWKAAVQSTAGVRLDSSDIIIEIPNREKSIRIGGKEGDAWINIKEKWVPCFRWQNGSIAFGAVDEFGNPDSDLRNIARVLARKLNARLCGDEGEEYD